MRTLPLLLVALALVPLAQAQLPGPTQLNLAVFTEDPGRAFTPGVEEPVVVKVNYQPGNGGRPAPAPTVERPEDTQPTRITLEVKQHPTWVTSVRIEPPELLLRIPVQNVSATQRAEAIAYLMVAPDAPALQRESFVVTATAEPNGSIPGGTAESADLKLRATTVGLLNVTAEPMAIVPGGRWTVVPFQVRNDGNSEIVAKVNVTVRPENSQVEFVDTLQLARNETKTVEVRVRTPWTNAELGTLELEAVPIVDGEEQNSARAEVQVRGQSAVPGAPIALVLLAVLLAVRRR